LNRFVVSVAARRYSSGATGTSVVGGRGSVLAVVDDELGVAGELLEAPAGVAALAEAEVAAAEAAAAAGALGRGRMGAGGASGTSAGAVAAADGAAAAAGREIEFGTGVTAAFAAALGRGRGMGVRSLSTGGVAPVIAGAFAIRGFGPG